MAGSPGIAMLAFDFARRTRKDTAVEKPKEKGTSELDPGAWFNSL